MGGGDAFLHFPNVVLLYLEESGTIFAGLQFNEFIFCGGQAAASSGQAAGNSFFATSLPQIETFDPAASTQRAVELLRKNISGGTQMDVLGLVGQSQRINLHALPSINSAYPGAFLQFSVAT